MALTYARVRTQADATMLLVGRLRTLHYDLLAYLDTNSDLAIDWAGYPLPDYLEEDADGNLAGYQFTRQEVANAIYSLSLVTQLLTAGNMDGTSGDHLGNLNKIGNPPANATVVLESL